MSADMLYGDVNPAGWPLGEAGGRDCHSEFAPFGFSLRSREGRGGSSAQGGGRRTETHTETPMHLNVPAEKRENSYR